MNFPVKQVTKRYAVIGSVLVLAGLSILGKAIYIMTVEKNFWEQVNDRFIKDRKSVV